jgi:hypothetical protein
MKEEDEVQCCSSQCAKNKVKIVEWTHKDGAKQDSPILGYGGVFGDIFIKHVLARMIKQGVSTCGSQDRHHLSQIKCSRKRYDLHRVSFLPVT